ncbi:glucan endo-1,3-beta-glucosidase-like [Wolffia australiana]
MRSIGVCYGRVGDNLPPPAEVIQMYKSLNIRRMRIYDPNAEVLESLKGTNIELLLDCPSPLKTIAENAWAAQGWVRDVVLSRWPDVRFKYIAVGNEVILTQGEADYILPAMQNIYIALAAVGLQDKIKVSTSVQFNVLGESFPPSAGEFAAEAKERMRKIAAFLAITGAPLLVNVYPYFSYAGNPNDISLDYALFSSPEALVEDWNNGLLYQNLFDAMVDAAIAALEEVGAGGVEIVVSESGWPSNAGFGTTVDNARRYNSNLIQHVKKGTPKRPGKEVETYIFAMFNENQKTPPGIENNFGLFWPNKQPVYRVGF